MVIGSQAQATEIEATIGRENRCSDDGKKFERQRSVDLDVGAFPSPQWFSAGMALGVERMRTNMLDVLLERWLCLLSIYIILWHKKELRNTIFSFWIYI